MKDQNVIVRFKDEMRNQVEVSNASTLDEAVGAADSFLEEYGMCVKNGGRFYGDLQKADDPTFFNVG